MLRNMQKKVDVASMTEEEQKLFRLYGKLPTHKNVLSGFAKKDRKFFDSGDYALQKAGKAPPSAVGTAIPSPENIPHVSTPPVNHLSVSPTAPMPPLLSKESKLAQENDPDSTMETEETQELPSATLEAPEATPEQA